MSKTLILFPNINRKDRFFSVDDDGKDNSDLKATIILQKDNYAVVTGLDAEEILALESKHVTDAFDLA